MRAGTRIETEVSKITAVRCFFAPRSDREAKPTKQRPRRDTASGTTPARPIWRSTSGVEPAQTTWSDETPDPPPRKRSAPRQLGAMSLLQAPTRSGERGPAAKMRRRENKAAESGLVFATAFAFVRLRAATCCRRRQRNRRRPRHRRTRNQSRHARRPWMRRTRRPTHARLQN